MSKMNWAILSFVLLAVELLAAPAGAFAQTEAGFMVNGVVSNQPNPNFFITASAVICPFPACTPSGPRVTHVNAGVSYEGFLAHRLVGFRAASLSFELPVLGMPNRGTNVSNVSYSTVAVTPGFRFTFLPKASTSPYISFGGGIVHFSGDTPSVTHAATRFGGGFDAKTPLPHVGLRIEVKDLISARPPLLNTGGVMHNVLFGGGVLFKF
jgi:hypothetical protein